MRILVTGANGWIGSAAVTELLAAGHDVVGMARTEPGLAAVTALGARAVHGDLHDPEGLRAAAADVDGVVHLAYHHDFSQMDVAAQLDRAAIAALGDGLAGRGGPLLIAAGTLGLARGRVGTEADRPDPAAHPRVGNAALALELADRGVRPIVVRFAPTVHGPGDHGFVAALVAIAREKGVAGYVGDGLNRWPAVHRRDAADLVRRAVEAAPAGTVVHAVAEEGITTRDIAGAIGRAVGVPTASVPAQDAAAHFGWLAGFIGADAPASSQATRALLDWHPSHPGLLADLEAGRYTGAAEVG